jgi:hypothetical protein
MDEYDLMGNYGGGYDNSYSPGYDNYEYTPPPVAPSQPMSYDDFGNPIYDEEEARKKREEQQRQIEEYQKQQEAMGSEVAHKQEVTTYADGSQTVKTQKEVPAPINPNAPQSPAQAQAQTADQISYNQDIQKQESGANPNIGYHNQQLSSAYGPYGITQAAWQDARKQNPYLPADIREATPEQMTQAQNAVTQNNAKYLQSYGVPVNNNTLAAAHFAGAKGLSDFLTKKDEQGRPYISPAAQAANGGYERAAAIINQRLGGQMAPASGAAQQAQPQARPQMGPITPEQSAQQGQQFADQFKQYAQPAQEAPRMAPNSYDEFGTPQYSPEQAQLDTQLKTYESVQNDPKALLNLEGPDWLQAKAKARAADILSDQRDEQRAMDSIKKADPKDLARTMMREPVDRLEIIKKSAMFRLLGAKDLANAELGKLGSTVEKYVQGADGKAYLLNMRPNGEVASGTNIETGQPMTVGEITKVGAVNIATKGGHMDVGVLGGISNKDLHQGKEIFNDPTGVVKGNWVLEGGPGRTPVYKEVGTGRVADETESAQLSKVAANKDALSSARTQATHAYTSMLSKLNKDREQLVQLGASEADLAKRGLDEASIQRKAQAAGQSVMSAATSNYGLATPGAPTGRAPAGTNISISSGQTNPTDMPAVKDNTQAAAGGQIDTTKTPTSTSVLANWEKIRPGEDVTNYKKRTQYTKEDIEAEAQQLVNGDKTLTSITGRDAGLLRHYASARAKEIDPTWSATDSNARADALKKWTNPDSQVSKQVRSHITAANSIQDVKDAFTALQNGNLPLFNQIKNDFEKNTGKPLPINAETGAMLLGPEIIKSIIPNGGGVSERLEAKHLLNTKLSPAQAKAVFDELETFQGNSLKALETDWVRAKLPKEQFRNRVLEGSPAAQELYDRASKHQADRAAGRVGLNSAPSKAEVEAELRRRGLIK